MNGITATDRVYVGSRSPGTGGAGDVVMHDPATGEGQPLNPRNDVRNHSPDGFQWGYAGSGPSQLALALCVDALGGPRPKGGAIARAVAVYRYVKLLLITRITDDTWTLSRGDILEAITKAEAAVHAARRTG